MNASFSRQRGLTLVELVVTMAVMALLLMTAAPSASEWIRNTRIRNAATSMQAGLIKARTEAMRRNAPVVFTLVSLANNAVMDNSCAVASNGVSWVVSLDTPGANCASAASDTRSATDSAWSAPRIVEKQAGGTSSGTVSVAGQVSATDATAASTVIFNGFGRVSNGGAIGAIEIKDSSGAAAYRDLRLVVGTGGTIRLCDPKVSTTGDPRKCA